MTSEKTDRHPQSQRTRDQEIDERYGAIGIAAVAAAVRYQRIGEAKTSVSGYSVSRYSDWPDQAE